MYSPDGSNIYGSRDGEFEGINMSVWAWKLWNHVPRGHFFKHVCCRTYRLTTIYIVTDGRTDGQRDRQRYDIIMPLADLLRSAKNHFPRAAGSPHFLYKSPLIRKVRCRQLLITGISGWDINVLHSHRISIIFPFFEAQVGKETRTRMTWHHQFSTVNIIVFDKLLPPKSDTQHNLRITTP